MNQNNKNNAVYGNTNPIPEDFEKMPVKRFGSVIGLNKEQEIYYRQFHAEVWDGVINRIKASNIRNYSIYITEIEGKNYLFSYFEYTGEDYKSDIKAMADDESTKRWWKETDPCQFQLPSRKAGDQWSSMEMVFFTE